MMANTVPQPPYCFNLQRTVLRACSMSLKVGWCNFLIRSKDMLKLKAFDFVAINDESKSNLHLCQ